MLKKSLFFVSLDSEMVHTHINDKEWKKTHTTDHTYIYSISSLMPEKASWYISYENTTFTFEKYLDWFEKKMTQTLNLKTSCNMHTWNNCFSMILGMWFFFASDNRRTQTCPNQKEKHCLAIRDTDTKIIKYSSAIWKP